MKITNTCAWCLNSNSDKITRKNICNNHLLELVITDIEMMVDLNHPYIVEVEARIFHE